jgi:hypothetical protein
MGNAGADTSEHYHSIHARGEKVEDVLRTHDEQNSSLLVLVFDSASCSNNLMLSYLTNQRYCKRETRRSTFLQ